MKLIPKGELDRKKWDLLVKKYSRGVHSYSWWLDEISENWCVYSDSEYTSGIALPFTERVGIKTLYTPIFSEYLEWLGPLDTNFQLKDIIVQNFDRVICGFENLDLELSKEFYPIQRLTFPKAYSKMAYRNMNKAHSIGCSVKWDDDFDTVFMYVESELCGRSKEMNKLNFHRLKNALRKAQENSMLRVVGTHVGDKLLGGIIFLETDNLLYYVKGAVTPELKAHGAMYLAMDAGIQYAVKRQKEFDFGGSRVEGVRRFNLQFGSDEVFRPFYSVNYAPKWFQVLQALRKRLP
jgi:hypothetical protein